MTTDQIYDQIETIKKGRLLTHEQALAMSKDYLADRRELDARRRNFEVVKDRTFFYLYVSSTNRTESQLVTGVIESDKDSVRCSNETREIGKRINAAIKRNAGTRTYETADGVQHDGCATLEKRCLELYQALIALKPLLESEVEAKPRNKLTREAIKPALAIIAESGKVKQEAM